MQEVPVSNVWFYCFPHDDFDETDPRVTIIKAFCIFFSQAGASLLQSVDFPFFLECRPFIIKKTLLCTLNSKI